ncbi:MAG: hypothetical protein Q4P84_08360, partial [Elusimicrobiales bacterium]|nr:hypothetical protein [Elusimicrobiales bacterium]
MKRCFASPLLWGILSLVIFWMLLPAWVTPGSGTLWLAQCLGAVPDTTLGMHPLASLVYRAVGNLLPSSLMVSGLMTLTAVLGALCVAQLCWVVKHFLSALAVDNDRAKPVLLTVQAVAISTGAVALLLTPGFLAAVTQGQWQVFDLFLLLCAAMLTLRIAENGSKWRLLIASFIWGLMSLEAPHFLALTPAMCVVLAVAYYFGHESLRRSRLITHLLLPMAVGFFLAFGLGMALTPGGTDLSLTTSIRLYALRQVSGILEWREASWILVFVAGIMPGLLALLLTHSVICNRRTFGQAVTLLALVVFAILSAVPNPLALSETTSELRDVHPLFPYALTAFAFAIAMGICTCFLVMKRACEGGTETGIPRRLCALTGSLLIVVIPLWLVGFGGWSVIRQEVARQSLKDLPLVYTDTILKACQGETLLISDGIADAYLALRVAEAGDDAPAVTIVPTVQDLDVATLEKVRTNFLESPLFAEKAELRTTLNRALDIGLVPFVQDWLHRDPEALQHLVLLSIPDLLLSGDAWPLPEKVYYRGLPTREALHAQVVPADLALFPALREPLDEHLPEGLAAFASYVRRQVGFIANNSAFFLADAGRTEGTHGEVLRTGGEVHGRSE